MNLLRRCVLSGVVLVAAACQSTAPSNLSALAEEAPSPYSVLVTGGAFLDSGPSEDPLRYTFATPENETAGEAIGIRSIGRALRIARVFHRVDVDVRTPDERALLVETLGGSSAIRAVATEAARAGHDYLLVIERLVDGPVREYGVNSRWPITAVAWIVLGIGMVIPDHTFESSSRLQVSMRDVHSGQIAYQRVFDGDPVDLALIDRTDFWGILASILVPPFWVGNDEDRVRRKVREATEQRLMFLLAQDLKSVACRDELDSKAPATIDVTSVGSGIEVSIRALEGVASVQLRIDGQRSDDADWRAFSARLLDGVRFVDGVSLYEAVLPRPPRGRFLQFLVQTVGGRVASSTIDLAERGDRR